MKAKPYPKTPELDKMKAVQEKSQVIGAFLDQLSSEGIHLARYEEAERRGDDEVLLPLSQSIETTLANYFDIDLNRVEKERRVILVYIRGNKP